MGSDVRFRVGAGGISGAIGENERVARKDVDCSDPRRAVRRKGPQLPLLLAVAKIEDRARFFGDEHGAERLTVAERQRVRAGEEDRRNFVGDRRRFCVRSDRQLGLPVLSPGRRAYGERAENRRGASSNREELPISLERVGAFAIFLRRFHCMHDAQSL